MFAYMKMDVWYDDMICKNVKTYAHLTLQAGRLESESQPYQHIDSLCSITNPNLGTTRPTILYILYNSITIHSSTENKEVLKDASDQAQKQKVAFTDAKHAIIFDIANQYLICLVTIY